MGWNPFESETKTVIQVATQVTRVIADDALPDSVIAGTIKSIFQDGNMPEYIMEEAASSIGVRTERMYKYAKDHYAFGLPTGQIYASNQGRAQVEQVIELLEGKQISIEYSHFGAPNALHIGWMKLVSDWGYNYETNELATWSAAKGKPCFLKDMVVVVPTAELLTLDARILEQWGVAPCAGYTPERPLNTGDVRNFIEPSDLRTSSSAENVYLQVTFVRMVNAVAVDETFNISLNEFNRADGYFHAKYYVDGLAKFWMYKNDSGGYPLLDAVYVDQPAVAGSYFPFVYFRYGKHSTIDNKDTEAYRTSSKLVTYLGMDYDTIGAAIDENPSIGDVEQAMLMFGVPAVSSNETECRYLFDYWDNMHAAMGGNGKAAYGFLASHIADSVALPSGGFGFSITRRLLRSMLSHYATRIGDSRYSSTFAHNGIYKRIIAGSIGAVGAYTSSYGTAAVTDAAIDLDTGIPENYINAITTHRYRHQISKNVYEEILVTGLRLTYNIWNGHSTFAEGTDAKLLIPLDKSVTENYSMLDREVLYSRAMHFVFNSLTITEYEVKWYQQDWFQAFVVIVAVVITVASYGSDGGSAIASALGLTGTAGLIATIVVTLAIGALTPKVFRLFVKTFGKDVATILAIAAIIYGGYSLATEGVAGAPMASDMLMLSTGMQRAVIESKFEGLLDEVSDFQKYTEEQTKLLDKANELLEKQTVLSPFVIFGEKPEDFYNRTVHYGNIGTLGITAVSSYVDIALTLPKIQDTLGEPLNDPS